LFLIRVIREIRGCITSLRLRVLATLR